MEPSIGDGARNQITMMSLINSGKVASRLVWQPPWKFSMDSNDNFGDSLSRESEFAKDKLVVEESNEDKEENPGRLSCIRKRSERLVCEKRCSRGVILEDEVMLLGTATFDDGYLLLDMKSEEFGSEEFKEGKETATAEENGEKNDVVLTEKGKEKAPMMELDKKSNLVSEIAKQAGEIQKFSIQEEAVASDAAKLKEAEDGYTVSTVIDNHKLHMNPHSVLPRSGSSVLSFNAIMVTNLFRARRASFIRQMSRPNPSARPVAASCMLTTQKPETSTELTGLHLAYLEEMSPRHLNRLQQLLSKTNEYSSRNNLSSKWQEYRERTLFLDDAVECDCLVYRSYITLASCQLVINEINDYVATPLQPVKLLALYLSSPNYKESTISSLKEWLVDSAIANNSILRLIGGIIFMHEQDYNEALKQNYLIFIFSSCRNSSARHIEGNFEIHVVFYTFLVIVGGREWEIRRGLQVSVDLTLAHLLYVLPLKVFFAPFDRGRSWDDGILSGISREICEYCNDGDEFIVIKE